MKSKEYLLTSRNRTIKAWLFFPDGKGLSPAVIVCHGIPGGKPVPGDSGYVPLADELASKGFAALIFNFSGCGDSTGNIDMNAWGEDLSSVYDFVSEIPGVDNKNIHIIGFSAGGATAVRFLAHENNIVKSLMLMATPADLSEIIPNDAGIMAEHFRAMGLIRDKDFPKDIGVWYKGFLSLKAEDFIKWLPQGVSVCIVHGDADTVVPLSHSERMYNAAPYPKKIIILKDAPHQLRKDDRTAGIILKWLDEQMTH